MKELAAASGLPIARLSHLRQTSGGGRSTSKVELADAIDGLFNDLGPDEQGRVTAHLIKEIIRLNPNVRPRLEELLERFGWRLLDDEPLPLGLRFDLPPDNLPPEAREALVKVARRYRDGDFDGAVTTIVSLIDTLTEQAYLERGWTDHRKASYQRRVVRAFRERESIVRARLSGMEAEEANHTWQNLVSSVNGAAYVLGSFRRNESDAHGSKQPNPELVQMALHSALFVAYSLID